MDPLRKVLSSGVASDPKDSKTFPSYKGKSFSRILYKFIYETEIVTFLENSNESGNAYALGRWEKREN